MKSTKTRKTEKPSNVRPVAATRIDRELFREIEDWCRRRDVLPAQVVRECIVLGWPLFKENPFAEREIA